jgi:hypothetical protein
VHNEERSVAAEILTLHNESRSEGDGATLHVDDMFDRLSRVPPLPLSTNLRLSQFGSRNQPIISFLAKRHSTKMILA